MQLVGVTTTLPDEVPYVIDVDSASGQEWYYWENIFFHNQSYTYYSLLPNHYDSKVGNTIGILITTNGQFHLFFNGKSVAKLATLLPLHKSLFGVIHVYSRCSKIKSEILIGELNAWCVCLRMHTSIHMNVHY